MGSQWKTESVDLMTGKNPTYRPKTVVETAGAPPTITVLVDLLGTFLVCQLVRMLLHSRMVDHDDMTKGYVWTVSSELEQWEEDLGMI